MAIRIELYISNSFVGIALTFKTWFSKI